MSATDQVRNLLDELMGAARDGGHRRIQFDDPRVCRSFLLDCCPHEILSGTRMDLGTCSKSHQVGLKSEFRRACEKRQYYYEVDALRHLEQFVADCNRRTEAARAKLRDTQEELNEEASEQIDNINKLSEEIGTTLAKAEQKGADGHVDESLKLMDKVEELKAQKAKYEAELRNAIPVSTYQQQKLRVCDVCSAYLGIHDNDRRLADHFGGKLHLGFIAIREKLEALKLYISQNDLMRRRSETSESRRGERREPSSAHSERTGDWSRDRERERRHGRRDRSRSRSRSRSRRRDYYRRSDRRYSRESSDDRKYRDSGSLD